MGKVFPQTLPRGLGLGSRLRETSNVTVTGTACSELVKDCHLWIVKQTLHDCTYVAIVRQENAGYLHCRPRLQKLSAASGRPCQGSIGLFSWPAIIVELPWVSNTTYMP